MSAKALAERQRYYDLLHHKLRVRDFSKRADLDWLQRALLLDSLEIVANPDMPPRSVDLDDAAYLRELDEFAASTKSKAA